MIVLMNVVDLDRFRLCLDFIWTLQSTIEFHRSFLLSSDSSDRRIKTKSEWSDEDQRKQNSREFRI